MRPSAPQEHHHLFLHAPPRTHLTMDSGSRGLFDLINRRGARALVNAFEREGIDAQIASIAQRLPDALVVYSVRRPLVLQNRLYDGQSDIQWPIEESPDSYMYRGLCV